VLSFVGSKHKNGFYWIPLKAWLQVSSYGLASVIAHSYCQSRISYSGRDLNIKLFIKIIGVHTVLARLSRNKTKRTLRMLIRPCHSRITKLSEKVPIRHNAQLTLLQMLQCLYNLSLVSTMVRRTPTIRTIISR
jgi:hypothetical protein